MRIGRPNDFAQEKKRWAGEVVFFQDRIERYVLAVVTEFAIRDVENDRIRDSGPVGAMREENKFRLVVDEVTDQPRAGDAVDFDFFASDPFHRCCMILSKLKGGNRFILVGKKRVIPSRADGEEGLKGLQS